MTALVTIENLGNKQNTAWGCNMANVWKTSDGRFVMSPKAVFNSCRSHITDEVFRLYAQKDYETELQFRKDYLVPPEFLKGDTCIILGMQNNVLKLNLDYIHDKEKRAKLRKRTKLMTVEGKTATHILVIGDNAWKSALWKLALYTKYIKDAATGRVKGDGDYADSLACNREDLFLSKLKCKDQVYDKSVFGTNPEYGQVHMNAGFVAIARGINKPMHKLLGFDKL